MSIENQPNTIPTEKTNCIILESYLVLACDELRIPEECTGTTQPNMELSVTRAVMIATFATRQLVPEILRANNLNDVAELLAGIRSVTSYNDLQAIETIMAEASTELTEKTTRTTRVMLSAFSDTLVDLHGLLQAIAQQNVRLMVMTLARVARSASLVAAHTRVETRQRLLDDLVRALPAQIQFNKPPSEKTASDGTPQTH